MTTAVQTRLSLTLDEVKEYLRVDTDAEDALIEDLLDAAKASADVFLNNPFLDSAGANAPIPGGVRVWVMKRAAAMFENRLEGAREDNVDGLGRVDYGRLLTDQAGSADFTLLRPYRLNPGL